MGLNVPQAKGMNRFKQKYGCGVKSLSLRLIFLPCLPHLSHMSSSQSVNKKKKETKRETTCSWSLFVLLPPSCSGGISYAIALAVCIDCEFQLWCVWIIGMQSAGHEERMCRAESTCTGLLKYSPHSPGNCSRSASALLPPSFALSPSCTSLNFSHLFACSLSFSLSVSHYLVHPLLLPPLPLFPHPSTTTLSLLPSFAASFLYFSSSLSFPTLTSAFLFCHL